MTDTTTTLTVIKEKIKQFVEERDWQQYHTPKNLSMSLAVEASELMELFLWVEGEASKEVIQTKRDAVEQELADVGILLLNFCMRYNIDLAQAIENKLMLNAQKYPIEKSKGRATKYTEL